MTTRTAAAPRARIGRIGTANPPFTIQQAEANALMQEHYAGLLKPRTLDVLQQVLSHPGIRQRSIAVDNKEQLVSLKNEDPDARAARFTRWAVALSHQAIERALIRGGLAPIDVRALVVNTCTGYICPGIATYLVEHLGLPRQVRAFDCVGSGCGGAIPCLQIGEQMLAHPDIGTNGVVVCVSVEICSATYQMGDDLSLVISNAIFGDGAAASVLWRRPEGLSLVSSSSYFNPQFRQDVRYVHKNGQLHNVLSPQLPRIVGDTVPPMVKDLLSRHGLSVPQVRHWAIHPGGDRMLTMLKQGLALSEEQLAVSRSVLADFGNMSSPTVLFELERLLAAGIAPGEWCVMVGFGAGFSAFAYLLQG